MPIYEYRCKSCEKRWEAMRPMRDMDAPLACPSCESAQTMRLLSVFAASMKGSPADPRVASVGDACATSAAWGGPCCRTLPGGGGGCGGA